MGLFSRKYETAGAGISKHAPKKKGIGLFFDIFGRKFWKLMELNLLYMLFFLPLVLIIPAISLFRNSYALSMVCWIGLILLFMVLIGPATAGMTKVVRKFFLGKHSFIVSDFFRGFKENFGKSAIIGFVDCLIAISVYSARFVYPELVSQTGSKAMYIPMVVTFSLFLVLIMMNFYIFLMMTATSLSMKNLFKNSFALAFVAMKQNMLVFVVSLAILALMFILLVYAQAVFFLLIAFFPLAFMCLLDCFVCYPVIQKYIINPYYTSIGEVNPELVEDTPEEEERIFKDMGGLEKPMEKPVESRKKGKGKRIS